MKRSGNTGPGGAEDGATAAERGGGGQAALTEFGRRVEELYLQNGYSTDGFARKVGISRQSLWRKLRGRSPVTRSETLAMATALGVGPDELTLAGGGQWEPPVEEPDAGPSPQGVELEEYVTNMALIVRTLGTFPSGETGQQWKLAYLGLVEDAARQAGARLPLEFWDVRRRVHEGAL